MNFMTRAMSVLAVGTMVSLSACDNSNTPSTAPSGTTPPQAPRVTTPSPGTPSGDLLPGDASNRPGAARTGIDPNGRTAMDQSESSEHIKVTADIRRAIMDDNSMSVSAQNVTIITDETGTVTLRGNVPTQAEKSAIEAKAKAIAGAARVDNRLVVKAD